MVERDYIRCCCSGNLNLVGRSPRLVTSALCFWKILWTGNTIRGLMAAALLSICLFLPQTGSRSSLRYVLWWVFRVELGFSSGSRVKLAALRAVFVGQDGNRSCVMGGIRDACVWSCVSDLVGTRLGRMLLPSVTGQGCYRLSQAFYEYVTLSKETPL